MPDLTDFQEEKDVVRRTYEAIDASTPNTVTAALEATSSPGLTWRGFAPFDEISGVDAVAAEFWAPLKRAMSGLHHRIDILFAGQNHLEAGGVWVASMGHLMGLFDQPWLGISPTGKMAFLRYAAFHRIEGGRIVDEAMYFDVPHLMVQAGCDPFPPNTGAYLVQPGPATHDGLLWAPQPPEEGIKTLRLIEAMIADLGNWDLGLPLEEELRRTWAEDMIWWGPHGIGATFTIPRYAIQHAGPFRAAFAERRPNGHVARLAEGHFGGFFGWPSFRARPKGGFLGMPETETPGEFRVIDIYRRAGDSLAENWIFIDLLHFFRGQGVDLLGRTVGIKGDRSARSV